MAPRVDRSAARQPHGSEIWTGRVRRISTTAGGLYVSSLKDDLVERHEIGVSRHAGRPGGSLGVAAEGQQAIWNHHERIFGATR
jgi:hypothetical protein